MASKDVLDKDQLNDIYKDVLARIDMGLASDESGELIAQRFNEQVTEAILEKMPDKPKESIVLDLFSTAFGVISERALRQHYLKCDKDWW